MMDSGFIGRTLKTCGILGLIILIFGSFYFGFPAALSVFTGIIWGMINLYFLNLLIRSALRPEGADKAVVLVLLLIKVPLLYLSGYFLMTTAYFNPLLLLAGFTATLLVIFLKAAGRALLKLDYLDDNKRHGSRVNV